VRGFDRFGLKTGGRLGVVKVRAEGTWRHREACVEAKRSREGGVSVCGLYKKMDEFAGVGGYCNKKRRDILVF